MFRRAMGPQEATAAELEGLQPANREEAALLQSVAESRQWRVRNECLH